MPGLSKREPRGQATDVFRRFPLSTVAVALPVWCRGPAGPTRPSPTGWCGGGRGCGCAPRGCGLSLRVMAMGELFRIPLFGLAMRTIGMIEVDRDSPDFRQIDQAAARDLEAGHSLLAHPEGRISPDGAVGKFKDGAFIIAVANQVPVVPVAIHGTRLIGHRDDTRSAAAGCVSSPGARCRPAA
jgi:1-acyl-sn-glycerol-3-phosphate acyltransferase